MSIVCGVGCSFVEGAEIPKGCSWIDVLGGINLGEESSGNIGAVNRLLLSKLPDDTTVFFMPTGMNRMDLYPKDFKYNQSKFVHVFPSPYPVKNGTSNLYNLELCLNDFVNETTEVLNAITNINHVQNYCKAKGFRLLMFPAFTREYTREYFLKYVHKEFVDTVEWNNFLNIDSCNNFFDWVIKQSGSSATLSMMEMLFSVRKFPELESWIMPKLHPSEKAHKLFAERLCEYL